MKFKLIRIHSSLRGQSVVSSYTLGSLGRSCHDVPDSGGEASHGAESSLAGFKPEITGTQQPPQQPLSSSLYTCCVTAQ